MKISNFPAKRDLAPRDKMHKQSLSSINSKLESGFTLIEMLVVIFVLSTIGVLVGAIITSALRGTNKTNTITTVRQNGFYTIAQMTKMIQNARKLDSPSCVPPPSPAPVPSYQAITITSADGGQTTFACCSPGDSLGNGTISSGSGAIDLTTACGTLKRPLLDTNSTKLDSCTFTCTQANAADPPIIGISFTLSQKSTTSFFEQSASIPFQTSVVMRNVSR